MGDFEKYGGVNVKDLKLRLGTLMDANWRSAD